MGTKLISIRSLALFAGFLLLFGCSTSKYQKFGYNNGPNPWVNAFKDNVFFTILRISYKNDTIFTLIEKEDAFNPYTIELSLEAKEVTKVTAKNFHAKIPPPSMCDDCKDMNYWMAQALHFYNSKDLNDLAWKEYKKFKKQQKEVGY